MPRIPQVVSDVSPRTAPLSLGVAEQPGEAAARLGQDVSGIGDEIVQKQIHLQQLNDYTTGITSAQLAIDQAVRTERENPDFRTQPDRINKAAQIIIGNTLKDQKYPEVRAQLQQQLEERRVQAISGARTDAFNKEKDYGQSMFLNSLEADRNRLNTLSGPERDFELSHVVGKSDAALSVGLFDRVQMQQIMKNFSSGIAEDKANIDGIIDPAGTAAKLVRGDDYLAIDPSSRLQLAQRILSEDDKRQKEHIAQMKEVQEGDVTGMTQAIQSGQASFKEIDGLENKWAHAGLPMPPHLLEFLYEKASKPPAEAPSDPATKDLVTHLMTTTPPGVAVSGLWDLHKSGKLNLHDYEDAANKVTSTNRWMIQQEQSLDIARTGLYHQILSNEFGRNPELMGQVLGKFDKATRFGGNADPAQLTEQLIKENAPLMERLGPKSAVGAQDAYESATHAYDAAVSAKETWDSHIANKHIWPNLGIDNPKGDNLEARKSELIDAAKAADKFLGPASAGSIEGSMTVTKEPALGPDGRVIPKGTTIMIINGSRIAR